MGMGIKNIFKIRVMEVGEIVIKRRIFIGFILISLITGLFVAFGRYRLEEQSKIVEIVLDYPAFEQLQRVTKMKPKELLEKLKDAGVTSVAIYEKTLNHYVSNNELVIVGGGELAREYYLSDKLDAAFVDLFQPETDIDNYFLLFTEHDTYQHLSTIIQKLPDVITRGSYKDYERGVYILEVENGDSGITSHLLGFSPEEIELISSAGLKVVPRVGDTKERLAVLPEILQDVQARGEISQIVFSGATVIGYPDRLNETAEILEEFGINVGMIEPFIGPQLGIKELAVLTGMNITRVHSFQQKEMDSYTYVKVLDRYIRSIKERNVRTLYYRPFLVGKEKVKPLELNQRLLQDIKTNLARSGYTLGTAQPFPGWRTSPIWIVILSIGLFAAGLVLLNKFIIIPDWVEYGLLVLAILGTFVLSFKGFVLLTRDMLALLAAVVFPSLAIIYGFDQAVRLANTEQKPIGQGILLFFKVIGITMMGVVMVIGLLSDVRYIYQINQFRGIKLTFILPLMIIIIYYILQNIGVKKLADYAELVKAIPRYLNRPVRYSHLLLFGLLGLAGLIYIGRTGNFPILPVSSIEIKIRDLLEDLLIYRPRFKEFAIGHPFMILALYYLLKKEKRGLALPLLIVGSIGQLTIINTFSHIHTPIIASLLRVISAIVLGIGGGLILIWLYNQVLKLWERLRSWVYD